MAEKKPSYWELLRDPRWQRKRLEVMKRDGFCCRMCRDETKTLNVHHTYYERGLSPWEYPDGSLYTLCEPCHKQSQERMAFLQRAIGRVPLDRVNMLIGFADAMFMDANPKAAFTLSSCLGADLWAAGVAKYFGIMADDVATYSIVDADGETEIIRGSDCLLAVAERLENTEEGT